MSLVGSKMSLKREINLTFVAMSRKALFKTFPARVTSVAIGERDCTEV